MTDSMVERDERATSSSSTLPSLSTLLASSKLRAGARWAVRGLVVAGFAGVAWLLSSGAAHAAGTSDHSVEESGLLSSVTSVVSTIVTPATTNLVAPANTLLEPVTRVTGALTETARPVTAMLDRAGIPVGRVVAPIRVIPRSAAGGVLASRNLVAGVPAASNTYPNANPSAVDVPVGRRDSAALRHRSPVRVATEAFGAKRVGAELPVLPRPGPAPEYPGTGLIGMPTNASGSPLDGSQYAVAPSMVASAAVAGRPLPVGTEVEVRRSIADAPTVSPD
jgi:hypothetical protein